MNELELFAALECVFNTEVHGGLTAIRVPWVPQRISGANKKTTRQRIKTEVHRGRESELILC